MQLPPLNNLILKNIKKDNYQRYLELIPNFKQEKTQKYITIILTLIASIILGIFALSPTLSTIVNLRKQLKDDRFVEQKLAEKINNLSVLQQKYSSLKENLPIIYDAVPKNSQITLLIAQLQALANESSIQLADLQTFQVDLSHASLSTKKFASYDFGVSVKGNYQNMLIFINKIANFQRVITIENISITKVTEINTTDLQLNIKGTAYFKE